MSLLQVDDSELGHMLQENFASLPAEIKVKEEDDWDWYDDALEPSEYQGDEWQGWDFGGSSSNPTQQPEYDTIEPKTGPEEPQWDTGVHTNQSHWDYDDSSTSQGNAKWLEWNYNLENASTVKEDSVCGPDYYTRGGDPYQGHGKGGSSGWQTRTSDWRKGFGKGKHKSKSKRRPHWAYQRWQERQHQAGKAANKGKSDVWGGMYTAEGYKDPTGTHWEHHGFPLCMVSFASLLMCLCGDDHERIGNITRFPLKGPVSMRTPFKGNRAICKHIGDKAYNGFGKPIKRGFHQPPSHNSSKGEGLQC